MITLFADPSCSISACLASCWAVYVPAMMIGGFFGVMALALVVAARDADDAMRRRPWDDDGEQNVDDADDDDDDGDGDKRGGGYDA